MIKIKTTRKNAPQAAKTAWENRLNITKDEWKHIARLYTLPLLKHTDKHLHFKHITHRRIGTRNRFPDSLTNKCRLCRDHQEGSCHLAWCPATKTIFETIDALAKNTPPPRRSRAQKVKDRLFAYPGTTTPDNLKALYIIAWKYIIKDFYRVDFEAYNYHYIPVLESTLMRFATLVRGSTSPDPHNSVRTYKAAQGRKPKIKKRWNSAPPCLSKTRKAGYNLALNLAS